MTTKTDSGTQLHIGVGVDTARYGHYVAFMNEEKEMVSPDLVVMESADGYGKFKSRLLKLCQKFPNVLFHIHIDAAGQYATNLETFLRGLKVPCTISIGEPKRNSDYHRVFSPKQKSDASEARAMARFAIVERPAPSAAIPQEIYFLCEIASRLESQVKTVTQAINRLHNLLSRVFPELSCIVSNIATNCNLSLLEKYPTPQRMARAALKSLAAIPYLQAAKAEKIHRSAKNSIASFQGDTAELLVKLAVDELRNAQKAQKLLEKMLSHAFEELPDSAHSQVQTIAGIGEVTAAVLVAKIVSIDRFETAEKLVGYFGVFAQQYSSGFDKQGRPRTRTHHMSAKGNDLVRRYLFCAAKSAIVHNPPVRALYARLRAKGTRGDVALGHCMRKLLHQVFGVWTTNTPYEKQYEGTDKKVGYGTDEKNDETASAQTQPPVVVKTEESKKGTGHRRDVVPAMKVVTAPQSSLQTKPTRVNELSGSVNYPYLRSQVTIEEVLQEMGHLQNLRGSIQRRGRCPFHSSTNPKSRSFSVNLEKHVFRCVHPECGHQGNALDLWAAYKQLDLHPAALDLAKTFNLQLNNEQRRGTRNNEPAKHSKSENQKNTTSGVITPNAI